MNSQSIMDDNDYNDIHTLHLKIAKGQKDEILDFLKNDNVNLRATDCRENTVIHSVIGNEILTEKEILELTEMFLLEGIDPNVENYSRETALHLAVAKRTRDVIDLLIKHNAEINIRGQRGNMITHYFIENEYDKMTRIYNPVFKNDEPDNRNLEKIETDTANYVEWLISKGFDFDGHNEVEESAVSLATNYGLQYILPILIKYTKDINYVNRSGQTLLASFLSRNQLPFDKIFQKRYLYSIMKMLLDKGVPLEAVDSNNETPLEVAIRYNEKQIIIDMLANHFPKGCDESSLATSRFYQIMNAWWSDTRIDDYLKILTDLVAKGADVNYQDEFTGKSSLYYAVNKNLLVIIEFLRENGANFQVKTKDGQSLLFVVSSLEVLDVLLSEGCEVNAVDENGFSPLHLAVQLSDPSIALKFIEQGADVNCKTVNFTTPLHYAVRSSEMNLNIIERLLDHRADVNAKNCWGLRPIHLVADFNYYNDSYAIDLFNLLLKRGAYLNTLDGKGESALCHALGKFRAPVIEELLKWGASINDDCIIRWRLNAPFERDSLLVLLKHWIKLEIAKLPCHPEYKKYVHLLDDLGYREECSKELEALKDCKIDSHTSFYRLLHMHQNDRFVHINNEKLLSIDNSSSAEEQFPKYSVLILAAYRQAVAGKALQEPAKTAWLDLTRIDLPDICIERILSYLSENELVDIIERDCHKDIEEWHSWQIKT